MISFLRSLFSLSEDSTAAREKIRFVLALLFVMALPFDMFYSTITLIILIVTTLLDLRVVKFQQIPKQVWIFQVVFFLSVIGYFYSTDKDTAAYLIQRQLAILLFPVMLPLAIDINKERVNVVLDALVLSCFCTTIFLFAVCLNIIFKFHLPFHFLFTSNFLNHRFSGPVGIHAGYLSLYVSLSILYIAYKLTHFLSLRKKIIYLIVLGVLVLGLMFLTARNTIITTAVIALFVLPFYHIKNKTRYFVVCGSVLVLLLAVASQSDYIKDRFSSELLQDINVKHIPCTIDAEPRIKRWMCAVELIKKAPVWGYGTGDEVLMLKPEYLKNNLVLSYKLNFDAHSVYLSYLLKNGIVGLLIFLAMCTYLLALAVQGKDFLYVAFLIVLLVGFFTENILDVNKGIFYFGFFNTLFGYRILFARRPLKTATPTVDL